MLLSAPQRLPQEQTPSHSAHSSPYSHRTTTSSDHSGMDSDDADMEPVQTSLSTTGLTSNRSSSSYLLPYAPMSVSVPLQMSAPLVKPEAYGSSEMMLLQYPASAWDEFLY